MKLFDNKGQKYLRKEFGAELLNVAQTLKPGNDYKIVNKVNCGNGGTEALLSLNMEDYPGIYLFIISHSQAGVQGKEDEGNHPHVVFLHRDKKKQVGISKKDRHYMCTPEAIFKRFYTFKQATRGSKVIFVFDEVHKSILDRSFRKTRFVLGHPLAISIGLTATPHQGQYHRTIMTVTNLPKVKRQDFVWEVGDQIKTAICFATEIINSSDRSNTNIVVAFHDTAPVLKMLEFADKSDLKVYVEAGATVSLVVKATEIYDKVVTQNPKEADFFLGTSSIVDSVSYFTGKKEVIAIIAMESGYKQDRERDGNKSKGFTDADAYQLPFRFRDAEEFTLIKIQKEEADKLPYLYTLTNKQHSISRAKHFVGEKEKRKSDDVLYSVRYGDKHMEAMGLKGYDKFLEKSGAHCVIKDKILEEIKRDLPPEGSPEHFYPYEFRPFPGEEVEREIPRKAFIDPRKYYGQDSDGESFKDDFKKLSKHITLPRKRKEEKITTPAKRLLYRYMCCRIFTNKLETPIGNIEISKDNVIKPPCLETLYNKLEVGFEEHVLQSELRFEDLLRFFHGDMTIQRFEEMRATNPIIKQNSELSALKYLYEYKQGNQDDLKEWVYDLRDESNHDVVFNVEVINEDMRRMLEESKAASVHELVLTRFDDHYAKKTVPLEEALNILLENEEFKKPYYIHNRQYGQLTKLTRNSRHFILDALYGQGKWKSYDCKSAAIASMCFMEYGLQVPPRGFYKGSGLDREISKRAAMIFTHKYFLRDENNKWFQYFPKEHIRKEAEGYLAQVSKHLDRNFIQAHIESTHELIEKCEKRKIPYISFYCRHTYYEDRIMSQLTRKLKSKTLKVNRVHDEIYIFGDDIPNRNDKVFEIYPKESKRKYNPFTLKSWNVTSWKEKVLNM